MSARAGALFAVAALAASAGAAAGCTKVLGFEHLDSLADGSVGQVCDNDTPCGAGESCVDGICKVSASASSGGSSGAGSSGSGSGSGSGGSGSSGGGSSGSGSGGSSSGGDAGATVETLAKMQPSPVGIAVIAATQTLVWTNLGSGRPLGYCTLPACSSPSMLMGTSQTPGQIIASGTYAYWTQTDGLYACVPPSGCMAAGYTTVYSGSGMGAIAVDPQNPTAAVYYASNSNVYTCGGQGTMCPSQGASILYVDGGAIVDLTVGAAGWLLVANGYGVTGCGLSTNCTQPSTIMALTRGATKVAADAMHTYAAVGSTEKDGGMTSNVVAMCAAAPSGCTTPDSYTPLFTPPVGAIVTALAADGGKLYWALSNKEVYSCIPSPGGCQSAPRLFTATSSAPQYFAFDASYVYFTDETAGTVGRIAK